MGSAERKVLWDSFLSIITGTILIVNLLRYFVAKLSGESAMLVGPQMKEDIFDFLPNLILDEYLIRCSEISNVNCAGFAEYVQ